MALRDSLPRLIDGLSDGPEDDEPETPEEAAAAAEAWQEYREGKSLSTEELKRQLGLS